MRLSRSRLRAVSKFVHRCAHNLIAFLKEKGDPSVY